jgi:hypothetical protein
MIPLLAVVASLIVCAFLWNQAVRPKTEAVPLPAASQSLTPVNPDAVAYKEYGNDVYYFEATGEQYAQTLSLFYEEHPGVRCAYQGAVEKDRYPGWRASGTHIIGHILHCYDPAVPAQDVTVP